MQKRNPLTINMVLSIATLCTGLLMLPNFSKFANEEMFSVLIGAFLLGGGFYSILLSITQVREQRKKKDSQMQQAQS